MRTKIPHNGRWLSYDTADKRLSKAQHDEMRWRLEEYKKNKLACFIPHGVEWSDDDRVVADGRHIIPTSQYPRDYKNDGVAFLNDRLSDGCIITGPNQAGKSVVLTAWTALRTIPCEKTWQLFTHTPVKWHEWAGPKIWVLGSYSWDNVDTLWQRVREFFPAHELGEYAPGGKKNLGFISGRPQRLTLACGSVLRFLAYTQAQEHWEGFNCDGGSFDEQMPKDAWIGYNRGTTTASDHPQFGMALTGHALKGRPDTGSAGWIKRDLYDGGNRMGKTISLYHLSIESAPDAIIPPRTKKALWHQWADPAINRSQKEEREGVARYWGGWEEGGGLLLEDWSRSVHLIDPLWKDNEVPPDATLFRIIDHGESKPTCCSWIAILPANNKWASYSFAVTYRMYYERGTRPAVSVPEIIRMSRNERILVSANEVDAIGGGTYQIWEEIQTNERYQNSLMDSRSLNMPNGGIKVGVLYARYGLQCSPASGQRNSTLDERRGQLDFFRDWLRIDQGRQHIVTKKPGAPRWYCFDLPCTRPLVTEIESLQRSDVNPEIAKTGQDDHAIDTHKFLFATEPLPNFESSSADEGDDWRKDVRESRRNEKAEKYDPFTGYSLA